jgi:predicted nucleotidyltransferase
MAENKFVNSSLNQIEKFSMQSTYSPEMQQQLKDSIELLKTILGSDLLGVYLYGSSLVGGLQKYSDIDLFVITNRATTSEEKAKLVAKLLQISGIYMKSSKLPIEITLVEKRMVNPWQYPPNFDFQYGDWLRETFEKGVIEPWENYEMPDLAVIVTQVLLRSETLWGLKPSQLLAEVPYRDFMKAMLHDVNRLAADLEHDTRNVLLTFARIWSTLETETIRPKPAAADWVMNHLPKKYQPVMKRAKSICMGKENEHWDDIKVLVKPCADFMVDKINAQIPLVNFDDLNKRIKIYEK